MASVGLWIDDPVPAIPELRDQELQDYQNPVAPFGERAAAIMGSSVIPQGVESAFTPGTGFDTNFDNTPVLSPEDANKKYGIGGLKFNTPIRDDTAQWQNMREIEKMKRDDIMSRTPDTFAGAATNFTMENVLDPANIAAAFAPGLPEARIANMMRVGMEEGGIVGKTAVRAVVGASQGMAGQAGLDALRYGNAQASGDPDFTIGNAMTDIAYGGVFGAGLHAGWGAIVDAITGKFRASPEAGLADNDPQVREQAVRSSLAQLAEGRPVEVRPVFDAAFRNKLMSSGADINGMTQEVPSLGEVSDADLAGGAKQPEMRLPVTDKNGDVMTYDNEASAQNGADRRTANGEEVQVEQAPDGSHVVTRPMDGEFVKDENGDIKTFDTKKVANKTRTRLEDKTDEPHAVIKNSDGTYSLVKNASEEDIASLNSRPDIAEAAHDQFQQDQKDVATKNVQNLVARLGDPAEQVYQQAKEQASSGYTDPAVKNSIDEAHRISQGGVPTGDAHVQFLNEAAEQTRQELLAAQKEGRIGPEENLDNIEEISKNADRRASLYEQLANCMTQEAI